VIDWSGIFSTNAQTILLRGVGVAVILGFHGWCIAWLARLLGDRGPEYDGRLSLDPFRQMDPVGALLPLFFRVGWVLPVEIDPAEVKGRSWGLAAIVLASLALLVAFAYGLWQLRGPLLGMFPGTTFAVHVVGLLEVTADLALRFAVFNLLPLPPLTAGLILSGLAPGLASRLRRHHLPVALAIALLVAAGAAFRLFEPVMLPLRRAVLG